MDKTHFLDRERDAAEWGHMWSVLADETGSTAECWQYMGSVRIVTFLGHVYWRHELQHRWRDDAICVFVAGGIQ